MGPTSGTSVTITTPGTYSFTLPFGSIITAAACWGGGGRGATVTAITRGGGGGGGAFSQAASTTLQTYAGRLWNATLQVVVGTGGNATVVNGGNSVISVSLAKGGAGAYEKLSEAGGGTGVANNITTDGKAGIVVVGTGFSGGNGGTSALAYGGGGGGGAGSSAAGGNASTYIGGTAGAGGGGRGGYGANNVTGPGTAGTAYGGGGGGARRTTVGTSLGGNGAAGAVYISAWWPSNVLLHSIYDGIPDPNAKPKG